MARKERQNTRIAGHFIHNDETPTYLIFKGKVDVPNLICTLPLKHIDQITLYPMPGHQQPLIQLY
jgi:hypothetical protein